VHSCTTEVSCVSGKKVATIEGLGGNHPLQKAWITEQVPQCGYCQLGQIMKTTELLSINPKPAREEIVIHNAGQHLPLWDLSQDVHRTKSKPNTNIDLPRRKPLISRGHTGALL
jgi:hypothetical protein